MPNDTYFEQERPEVLPFLPKQFQTVLEVGCGKGTFAAQLARNAEVWGVEPDPGAADTARQHLHSVMQGTYDEVEKDLPRGHFDLVICNDVIEHMPDHDAFLSKVAAVMKPDGVLVASIPNIRQFNVLSELLFSRDFRYRDSGILDRTHLRFFTEKSLRRCLQQHGYKIESFGGINPMKFRLSLKRILMILLTVISFGAYRDIWFAQFAFRARRPAQTP